MQLKGSQISEAIEILKHKAKISEAIPIENLNASKFKSKWSKIVISKSV
jgi:hypothetical protein